MSTGNDRFADIEEPTEAELAGDVLDSDAQPNPVDMVVFDLGNVLMKWNPLEALEPVVGAKVASQFLSDPRVNFPARNLRADAGEPWPSLVAEIAEAAPEFAEAAQAYVDNFSLAIREPIEGTVEILRELHEAEMPLFALTNFSAELFPIAREHHTGFLDLFDDIIVSGEEGVTKPDAEIWEILEEVTRHVGGLSDAIFIDDSPTNVMGAEQAGLDAICFTDAETLRADLNLRGLPLKHFHDQTVSGSMPSN